MWIDLTPEELKLIRHCVGSSLGDSGKADGADALITKLDDWERDARSPLHKLYRDTAWNVHHRDGECEIDHMSDETCMVSKSDDPGAYVMAWVWVDNETAGICSECGDFPGSETYGTVGDGYDGLCPSCADKVEEDE